MPVQYILELSAAGYGVDEIHAEYPTVPKGLVAKIITLLRENKVIKIAHGDAALSC